jgi:hypothetical protein
MSETALRSLVAHAVVDARLCAKLLNGERESVLARFELSEAERAALREIRAQSLQGFAAQLDEWMRTVRGGEEPRRPRERAVNQTGAGSRWNGS